MTSYSQRSLQYPLHSPALISTLSITSEVALHFRYEIGPMEFCFEHEKAISKPIWYNTEVTEV